MAPIRTYNNWNSRPSNHEKQIEPYRRYYIICEGKNTETWYFKKLIDIRKFLSIHAFIDVIFLEKIEEYANLSSPKKLLEIAEEQKNSKISFDHDIDKMIVIFDADVFEKRQSNYQEIVEMGIKRNVLGVTNPSFELFLLLHFEGAVEDIIKPDSANILMNNWIGRGHNRRRYIDDIFRKKTHMNPKTNPAIGELANQVLIAIKEEKKLNNDIMACKGNITSNIGVIIQSIIDDQCNN
jgi:hypothetical protein